MKELTNKKWFLFEEVLNYCLWMGDSPMGAFFRDLHKQIGTGLYNGFFITKRGLLYMFFESSEYQQAGKFVLAKTLEDYIFLKTILDDIERLSWDLIDYSKKLSQVDFSLLSNKQLWRYYDNFYTIQRPLWVNGQAVNLLEMDHSLLSDEIKKRFLKIGIDRDEIEKIFSVLVSPEQYSFSQKEEQDLMVLAIRGSFNREKIIRHWRKYCWLGYNWTGPAWDKDYFVERLKLLKNDNKIREILLSERDYIKNTRHKKKAILKKYNFSGEVKDLIKLAERILFLKGLRVDASWKGYYEMERMFKEIGRRFNLTLRQIYYIFPDEMKKVLAGEEVEINVLNRRWQMGAIVFENQQKKEVFGAKAEELLRKLLDLTKAKYEDLKELEGDCGSPGKAGGTVRVVNFKEDMAKMEQGNILVSHATNPSLVPAMRKASAIVADVGGLTCHAAIVARELRIPCVIGTKIATRVLKDGDRVEVDADKGVVKIIE